MKKITITFLAIFIASFGLFSQSNWEWTQQESGTMANLRDVFFVNNMTGWAVGSNGTILNTSDGGSTWSAQTSGTDQELEVVHFIDENTGWVTGGGVTAEAAPLLKTTDGGENWEALSYNFNAFFIRDLFFVDENVGWVIKTDSIYRSTDGGLSWIAEEFVSTVNVSSLSNKGIFATSDSIAFVAGRRNIPASNKTATVLDRREYNAPNFWGPDGSNQFDDAEELQCITFANDSVGFVGGVNGKIFRMQITSPGINNGPWNLNFDIQSSDWIRSISFPNSNVGMFNTSTEIGGVNIALVYHTEDQGETWTSTPDSIPDILLAKLFAADEDNAWIVASAGKIYNGVPGPSSIFDNRPEINFSVFPNPTSGLITINNPDRYNNLTISVTNLMGQLVSEFVMENTEKLEINIEGEPGIYFVKALNENGGQRVIKVIKE
jgi:hypothetical protein